MDKDYQIRTMRPDELQIAINWAKEEGWNPGLHDAESFYFADPTGFFIGELKGEPISVACAVNYDELSSFFGLYIVKQGYRGQGYGLPMTMHCLEYSGERNLGLDGVLENVKLYERLAFKPYFINHRYQIKGSTRLYHDPHLMPLSAISIQQLIDFDAPCFFGKRARFLEKWITQRDTETVVFVENNVIKGYGVCRQCYQGFKIGPLFADDINIAESIFLALLNYKTNQDVFIDIPEINIQANKLIEKYQLEPVFSVMRMYRQFLPEINYDKIFGMTTYEIG